MLLQTIVSVFSKSFLCARYIMDSQHCVKDWIPFIAAAVISFTCISKLNCKYTCVSNLLNQ